jgi:hypothetical protein
VSITPAALSLPLLLVRDPDDMAVSGSSKPLCEVHLLQGIPLLSMPAFFAVFSDVVLKRKDRRDQPGKEARDQKFRMTKPLVDIIIARRIPLQSLERTP